MGGVRRINNQEVTKELHPQLKLAVRAIALFGLPSALTPSPPKHTHSALSPPVDAIQLCGREGVRERVYTLGLLSTTFVFDLVSVHCLSRDSADLCVTLTQGALIHA